MNLKSDSSIQSIIDGIADPIIVIDPKDHRVLWSNEAAKASAGCEIGERPTCHWLSHCRDKPCHESGEDCPLPAVVQTRKSVRTTHIHCGENNRPIHVDILASPIVNEAGEVTQIVEIIRDITEMEMARKELASSKRGLEQQIRAATAHLTEVNRKLREENSERKLAENALKHSEERYRTLFESLIDAAFLVDAHEGRILDVNRQAMHLTGRSKQELVGTAMRDLHAASPSTFDRLFGEPHAGQMIEGDDVIQGATGEVPVEMRSVFFDTHEDTLGLFIYHDASELRASEQARATLESQLEQAAKLEAIGRLAGGIAHDFNNMLAVILGTIQEQRRFHHLTAAESFEHIERAAKQAAILTKQLLAFGRRTVLKPQVIDLNTVVKEVDEMLRRIIGGGIKLDFEYGELDAIYADPSQLAQVVVNLAINAKDAINTSGHIVISTFRCTVCEPGGLEAREGGEYMVLRVQDNGVGMSETVRSRIFEPFFTTKEEGKGTGLGLAMAYGIVKQSGGFIDVRSVEGEGTQIDIYLPSAEVHEPDVHTEKLTATILLLDDEDLVRNLNGRLLEFEGHKVIQAANIETARGIIRKSSEHIDLLLTDVLLPGMRGDDFAQEVTAQHPNLKVLCISANPGSLEDSNRTVAWPFLAKPFKAEQLLAKVAEVLRQ